MVSIQSSNDIEKIEKATHIFLPGVGALKCNEKLENANLINCLRNID